MAFLHTPLSSSPASFETELLGSKYTDPQTGYEYQFVKNTDSAVLSPGMVVTWEDVSAFEVDKASGPEQIRGVVPNELTGTTVAVNDAFWMLTKGWNYGYKCASGGGAIAAKDALQATGLPRPSAHSPRTKSATTGRWRRAAPTPPMRSPAHRSR